MSNTPETDAQLTTYTSISKLKKPFTNKRGTVSAEFARKLERKLAMATESLKFIAEEGGKVLESEYGDISCNGIWCSDQAQHALYALEDMK